MKQDLPTMRIMAVKKVMTEDGEAAPPGGDPLEKLMDAAKADEKLLAALIDTAKKMGVDVDGGGEPDEPTEDEPSEEGEKPEMPFGMDSED